MTACCGEAAPKLTTILGNWGSARWASSGVLSCGLLLGLLMGALPAPSSSSIEFLQSIPHQGLGNAAKHGMYFSSKHVPCMPMHVWCRLAGVVLQRLACRCVRFCVVDVAFCCSSH